MFSRYGDGKTEEFLFLKEIIGSRSAAVGHPRNYPRTKKIKRENARVKPWH